MDQRDQEGRPWPGCQRTFLGRMLEDAAEMGLRFEAGYELEWTVGREDGGGKVEFLHDGPGYGAATFGRTGEYLLALVDNLQDAGVGVEQVHPEYSPGQIEISLPPGDPVRACDASVLARHIARTVAEQAGWRASFSPVVTEDMVGNGAHAHFSVWREGENQFSGGRGAGGAEAGGRGFPCGGTGEHGGADGAGGADRHLLPAAEALALGERLHVLGAREPRGGAAPRERRRALGEPLGQRGVEVRGPGGQPVPRHGRQ